MMSGEIVNKVAESGIVSIDLEELIPAFTATEIDLKDQLWQGIALREAEFRAWLKNNDFSGFQDKIVGVHCSTDALLPTWAWMLIASRLHGIARYVGTGDAADAAEAYVIDAIRSVDRKPFEGKRVVVKGCSERSIAPSAYLALTRHLQPVVKSLMFGEPCSTVPVYKAPRNS
jgi:hypothetical protein